MTHSINRMFAQLGYVTRNLDAACANCREHHGIQEFLVLDPPVGTRTARAALAYKDNVMIEVIEPTPGAEGVYRGFVPEDEVTVRLHHIAYVVDDFDDLQAACEEYRGRRYDVPVNRDTGRGVWLAYIDTCADLGHFTELLYLFEEGRDMFARVPVN